jgi:alpha-glucosidase
MPSEIKGFIALIKRFMKTLVPPTFPPPRPPIRATPLIPPWWHSAVFYQIYPRSFADSNHDGVGDLEGIRQRLDYLQWLGIDALWISPFYPSPMEDFGYDIANYCDVDPVFGSLSDFDRLLTQCHEREIRLVLDFVPNHTSIEHPWFQESRRSRSSCKRDWYVWHSGKSNGEPPNNWQCYTGGSAWGWDAGTKQYYLFSHLPCQPDLNWRNPAVRQAMFDVLRFWLDRGVDGFRIDMIDFLVKDAQLRSDPPNPNYEPPADRPWYTSWYSLDHQFSKDQPEVHDILREVRRILDGYGDRCVIGEMDMFPVLEYQVAYYGANDEVHLPFNFGLISHPFRPSILREFIRSYDETVFAIGWPNYTLGNHDVSRLASRIGRLSLKMAAMLLLTLRGTPFIYNGEELGLENGVIPAARVLDPWAKRYPEAGRDVARTPIPWEPAPIGGFSSVEPWLPVGAANAERNVRTQIKDPESILNFYRRLLRFRRETPALQSGNFRMLDAGADDYLLFERRTDRESLLIALNFGSGTHRLVLPTSTEIVFHSSLSGQEVLGPFEGKILRIG